MVPVPFFPDSGVYRDAGWNAARVGLPWLFWAFLAAKEEEA
jgi:hypothetical protein